MTNTQLFFAVLGSIAGINSLLFMAMKFYIDAKIDPIGKNVDTLVQYMISHEGRLATLEERTKK